jgi:hypothetical protein
MYPSIKVTCRLSTKSPSFLSLVLDIVLYYGRRRFGIITTLMRKCPSIRLLTQFKVCSIPATAHFDRDKNKKSQILTTAESGFGGG